MTEQAQQSTSVLPAFMKTHGAAATVAGVLEIGLFHPFDTVAKRLMSHEAKVVSGGVSGTLGNLNQAVFKKHANSPIGTKIAYMYPGSLYAICYKVSQRVYKFAGQPIVRDYINKNHSGKFETAFGTKKKLMTEATAGSLIGIGEVILLPLDRLKVLSQTNPEALRGRGMLQVFRSEGLGMYAGTGATIARNAPGSFCLFGGAAITKDWVFGLQDYSKATFVQNTIASSVGAVASIVVTNPMDVVKTRIQNKNFGEKVSAVSIMSAIVREEGPMAFLKGVTPKVFASAPKLIFAYTFTEQFAKWLKTM